MTRETRWALMAGATLVALAAGAVAAAKTMKCLPPVCERGKSIKGCCTEPICDFMAQIRMKRAMQNFFLGQAERSGVGKPPGTDPAAMNRERQAMQDALDRTLGSKALQKEIFGSCDADMNDAMPKFETDDQCRVTMNKTPSSREGAQARGSSCSEMVDAAYTHEKEHSDRCWKMGSDARARISAGDFAFEEVEAYQKEIDALSGTLASWARACSKAPGAKNLDRQLKQLEQSMKSTERRRKSLQRRQDRGWGTGGRR